MPAEAAVKAALPARNRLGATVLNEAVRHARTEVVKLLMKEAAELASVSSDDGVSPLYLTAVAGSGDGRQSPASFCGREGRTALHAAAAESKDLAHYALAHGQSINTYNLYVSPLRCHPAGTESRTPDPSHGYELPIRRWRWLRRRSTRPLPPELSVDALGRCSCDAFSSRSMLLGVDEPRASCDGRLTPMLFIPRSDNQIPVEEEKAYEPEAVPGGSVQTRDYYLDSSSSSRRRRSVDRKSFSSDAGELPTRMPAANARVSPAVVGAELYQQQQSSHYQYQYQCHQANFVEPPFLGREEATKSKPKSKGIKGWSIWGLLHKKSSGSALGGGAGAPGKRVTIQEPTFEEVIVLYRRKSPKGQNDRAIHVKHFKNIPMADMELVLPKKKNPSLTPMDWVQFILSVVIGLVTLISSL
ncbi:hypothetical protein E2562_003861 [Oryza meyeriana var. granulata]|uniref:Uncharacterized protein n=1 Tax=Oryza meyeriana var. granulata TaxID=110450 RepID=A0A6G1CYQ6_9ORYZ|nr:hypothetical protein E2562_003861 [Oryza meyeriana var. granulata]